VTATALAEGEDLRNILNGGETHASGNDTLRLLVVVVVGLFPVHPVRDALPVFSTPFISNDDRENDKDRDRVPWVFACDSGAILLSGLKPPGFKRANSSSTSMHRKEA
jgi:hypothetical protein